MTASDHNDTDAEKSTDTTSKHVERHADTLRATADELSGCMTDLADAIERGEADADLVDHTFRKLAAAYVPIEDTADLAGVIDGRHPRYRAMDSARRVLYRETSGDHKRAAEEAREAAQHIDAARREE